jgi:hypothetical protein
MRQNMRSRRWRSTAGTTILYHLRNYLPDPSLSVMTTGRAELLEHDRAAATAGAAGPSRDYGPDGAAGGLRGSTPRQADDTTTRPSGSGPTLQADARDSESLTTCYGPQGTGWVPLFL